MGSWLKTLVSGGVIGLILAMLSGHTTVAAQATVVRLATVRTAADSGLLREILPDFERQTGYSVEVLSTTQDVFDRARAGEADLVISHYGYEEVERFVMPGLGLWPRAVFANQVVVLGPPGDPAQVRGLTDAVEGFRRIAQTQSLFLVNNDAITKQMTETLWEAAGRPDRGAWYMDFGLEGSEAIEMADSLGAYTIWGLDPFRRFQGQRSLPIQVVIMNEPLLQRIMASVVVNAERIPGANMDGAQALQRYLLAPATQARIRAFRYPGVEQQVWWPAGGHNIPPER